MPFCSRRVRSCCAVFSGLVLSATFVGCGTTESTSVEPAAPDSTQNSTSTLSVTIPDGTPDELFQYIASLDAQGLPDDASERGKALLEREAKRVKACDAILAQQVAPEAESSAVQIKLDALRTLSIVDPNGTGTQFQTYVTSLIDGGDPYLSRLAKAKQFQAVVNDFVANKVDDHELVQKQLTDLLRTSDVGPRVFMEARDAIGWMVPKNSDELTTEQLTARMALVSKCYRALGNRFASYADKDVMNEAVGLLTVADQFELELLRASARNREPDSVAALLNKLKEMYQAERKHGGELGFTIQTAQGLELEGMLEPAMQLYELAWKHSKHSEDEGVRESVKRSFEKATTRLNLVGNSMQVSGKLAGGKEFDLEQYAGKHVVVCFWESWVTGWQDEVKNMQAAISKFPNKQIEIVTVNLDAPDGLAKFMKENSIDVPILAVGDDDRSGTECSTAIRYGVDMLPFTVLVGPDGKVNRIHVFGPHLESALQEAVGSSN